jgi:REP element-mobilizing transposase RayT
MPQSFTSLHYHIVFSTKDRRPMIADDIRQRLYDYIGGILDEFVTLLKRHEIDFEERYLWD